MPIAIFEELFASKRWQDSWRERVYDFPHFHTHRHDVPGKSRRNVQVTFGGAMGKRLYLEAGDVAISPAGTRHGRIEASDDLLVVGAYPQNLGGYK